MYHRLTFLTALLVFCANSSRAEQWFSPSPRVFASVNGRFAIKVVPDKKEPFKKPATGVYFSLDADGKEQVRWTRKLVNVPHEVLISDYAYIATINTWGGLGREHSIVLYGWRDGAPLVDLPLEKLLSNEEIAKHTKPGSYSRPWTHTAKFKWEQDGSTSLFRIQFDWGKDIVFELTELKVSIEVNMEVSYSKQE